MQLRRIKSAQPAQESMNKITACAWSPNNRRLAIVAADRIVQLYDENGTKRDKFATKAADKGIVIHQTHPVLEHNLIFENDASDGDDDNVDESGDV